MTSHAPVGVVGLGVMGSAMSAHLLAAGFPVLGFDIDARRRDEHGERGGAACRSAAEVAAGAEVVVTSLPSETALLDVLDGLRGGGRAGLVVVETSTLSPEAKQDGHDRARAWGATMLDCPMSGTGQQARDGDLVAYLSGDPAAKRTAMPMLAAFTRAQHDLGAFGQGTMMKLVANLLVTVHNAAAAEALLLAQRVGLDLERVIEVVGDGAGGSRMLAVRGPLMAAGRYVEPTATVATTHKDNALIATFAVDAASPTPLFATAAVLYQAAVAQGRLHEDTACVFAVLQRLAGQ
jgi:3-hydroxyisobutyrate dehydrogenase-like beta-hydroxyacid dehydrogenase